MRITKFAGVDMPAGVGASISFKTPYGNFIIAADGLYNYESNKSNPDGYSVLYDYFAKDGDGDTTAASLFIHFPSFATHTPEDDFTHVVDVTGDFTATGTSSNETYWLRDSEGGNKITGGPGDDYFVVTGDKDSILNGNDGNDIIKAGSGSDEIHGGNGDDTLYGGHGNNEFFGEAGHDAMLGLSGNDTFHNIDADDLDGTNTLDGTHSIMGGSFGHDTVQLGGLTSFDQDDAKLVTQIEELDLKANSAGQNAGTTVTLDYAAVYGVTEVGGLHVLTITGDASGGPGGDKVSLQNDGIHNWSAAVNDGAGFNVFTAGSGVEQVTVKVQEDITVN
jgi:Ca2+-binding RTX toxin-like protein